MEFKQIETPEVHYVCTGGCGRVMHKQIVCRDFKCMKYNEPLVSCTCEDRRHREAFIEAPVPVM